MRMVGTPHAPSWALEPDPARARISIGDYLRGRGCALAAVEGFPPVDLLEEIGGIVEIEGGRRLKHTFGMFAGRCALHFGISAEYILTTADEEQNILAVKSPETIDPEVEFTIRTPAAGEKIADPGAAAYLTKGRLLTVTRGERRAYFLCGAGCPDPGEDASWSVELYIGLWRQVYHAARLCRRDLDEWTGGKRAVQLYPRADQLEGIRAGQLTAIDAQRANLVACGDAWTYVLLKWCPSFPGPEGEPARFGNVPVERAAKAIERFA